MKNNIKKLAYSRKIVDLANMKRFKTLAFILSALLVVIAVSMYICGDITIIASAKLLAGGVSYATIVGFGTIAGDPANELKVGKQVKNKLYFIEASQYDDNQTFPTGNRSIGNIPLLSGQYWNTIEAVLDTPELSWKGTKGDLASTITNTAKFVLGGMGDDVFTLLEKGIGKGFYVVYEVCSTGEKWITGNGCKPAILKEFDGGSDKDKTGTTVTFECECGKMWVKYEGTTPTQAAATVAADATTITMTSNPQYQLTNGTSTAANITAFTGVTDSDIGRIVTLLGSGGTHPSTIDTGDSFIVGSTWTALSGKQISFKVYKDTSVYKFVEVSRN
jgi:hypothetical protein